MRNVNATFDIPSDLTCLQTANFNAKTCRLRAFSSPEAVISENPCPFFKLVDRRSVGYRVSRRGGGVTSHLASRKTRHQISHQDRHHDKSSRHQLLNNYICPQLVS